MLLRLLLLFLEHLKLFLVLLLKLLLVLFSVALLLGHFFFKQIHCSLCPTIHLVFMHHHLILNERYLALCIVFYLIDLHLQFGLDI